MAVMWFELSIIQSLEQNYSATTALSSCIFFLHLPWLIAQSTYTARHYRAQENYPDAVHCIHPLLFILSVRSVWWCFSQSSVRSWSPSDGKCCLSYQCGQWWADRSFWGPLAAARCKPMGPGSGYTRPDVPPSPSVSYSTCLPLGSHCGDLWLTSSRRSATQNTSHGYSYVVCLA